jgi:hypothetical protein
MEKEHIHGRIHKISNNEKFCRMGFETNQNLETFSRYQSIDPGSIVEFPFHHEMF